MNIEGIILSLTEFFSSPLKDGDERKIIYWVDREKAFEESFNVIDIKNVKKHILHEKNYFKTKYLLEVEDKESNYLIYTQDVLGENNDNWLLDNILYSTVFYADEVSIYSRDLGIPEELRKVVVDNKKFFAENNRYAKFKSYNIDKFSEESIEIAIISVITNQKSPNLEESLRTILMDNLNDEDNQYLKRIKSFFSLDKFWKYMGNHYGYIEDIKSLKQLLIHLIITTISTSISNEKLDVFKNFIAKSGKGNCTIFIDRWMNHKTDYEVYDRYAEDIEKEIVFSRVLQNLDIYDIRSLDIFSTIDQAIILYIVSALENNHEDFEEYKKLLRLRKTKHYYGKYRFVYEGLFNTINILAFKKQYTIPVELPEKMVKAYVDNYYLMDQYYRKFYIAYDKNSNSQILQKLRDIVEGVYTNWFMMELSYNWSESLSSNIINDWRIPKNIKQSDFYKNYIDSKIVNGERVFVIVSDALRYEVAAELCDRLDAESLGSTELIPIISGLPSDTKFGMARLLPHNNIKLMKNGFVHIDGLNSGSMDGRKQILSNQTEESTAINYNDYMSMNREETREYYKGKILNYIYHNTIDAIGDAANTEIKAFDSTELAIEELSKLIRSIRVQLSGTNIFITSDHGFIYQRDKIEEVDKIAKENLNSIESKRRYIFSEESRDVDGLLKYSMKDTLGMNSNINVYIPKANIRFKTQGSGANFVHGGASLQEVVVPLILYKDKRSGQSSAIKPEKTRIKLTNTVKKITNSIFTLNFFQTEKIGGKIVPLGVRVYMINDNDEIISNEEILLGDKESDNPEDRTMSIRFILKPLDYDRNKKYYLIIKDVQTGVGYDKIPFDINLSIVSDFDF